MVVIVLFVLCVITEISSGPVYHRIKRNNDNELTASVNNENDPSLMIPHWPTTDNTFLLPKMFALGDQITIDVSITSNTKRINISLITHENETADNSVCTFKADLYTNNFSVFNGENEIKLESDLKTYSNGSEFYVKFIRKEGNDQENNILDIEGLTPVETVKIASKNMDHIRYIRVNGDNIKVRQFNMSFA